MGRSIEIKQTTGVYRQGRTAIRSAPLFLSDEWEKRDKLPRNQGAKKMAVKVTTKKATAAKAAKAPNKAAAEVVGESWRRARF